MSGVVIAAGLAAGLALASGDVPPTAQAVALLGPLVGCSFVAAGIIGRLRRPSSRVGLLLVAVGVAWLLSRLESADATAPFALGLGFDAIFAAVLVHLLLAFPSGRLPSRLDRVLTAVAYLTATAVGAGRFLFGGIDTCADCARRTTALVPSPGAFAVLTFAEQALAAAVLVGAAALLIRRWQRTDADRRRVLALVGSAGLATLLLNAAAIGAALARTSAASRHGLDLAGLGAFGLLPFAFLAGLLRSHAEQSGPVRELVERLGAADLDAEELRTALAETVGDPSLEVAYWIPALGRHADAAGDPVELPSAGSGRAWTEVERGGRRSAALIYDAEVGTDSDLVRTVGSTAVLALENQRLETELGRSSEEARAASRRVVEAQSAERRRLERNLHDGAQHRLVSLLVSVNLARRGGPVERAAAGSLLDDMARVLTEALAELRDLSRGFLPPTLTELGLEGALRDLAQRSPVPAELSIEPGTRFPAHVEAIAYFVVAEALSNVAKHARARRVAVRVAPAQRTATVEIRDDGVGGATAAADSGLCGLAERVRSAGGRLELDSPPSHGTVLRAEIPITPPS